MTAEADLHISHSVGGGVLIAIFFGLLAAYFLYKWRRDHDLLIDTLRYYEALAARLAKEIHDQNDLSTKIAHDLKSPLSGLISSAQALELSAGNLPQTLKDCLQLMQTTGRSNLRLLANFLELMGGRARLSPRTLPECRTELLKTLVEPQLVKQGRIEWKACPWMLKTSVPFYGLGTAIAELVSLAFAASKSAHIQIEETFDLAANMLCISISPMPEHVGDGMAYSLAIKVLNKYQLKHNTLDLGDGRMSFDLFVPICESVATEVVTERSNHADATLLVEASIREVENATQSLEDLGTGLERDGDNAVQDSNEASDIHPVR